MNNKHPIEDAAPQRETRQLAKSLPQFEDYEVLDELGRGGFGAVYLALDLRLERMVALKVLHANLAADSVVVERFKREAKALARLSHPNIVLVFSVEDGPPSPFIVMEYVEGLTLERRLMKGAWPFKEAIHILWQVAEALDMAHEQGLIHRDVKPSNILITRDKVVKLTDFGIAKMRYAEENQLTATNMTLGTVQYMAPEQSDINRQHEIGPAADIYALAVVAYQILAGRVPFKGDTHAVLLAHHTQLPPDPSTWGANVSPSVLAVLRQALAKDPSERSATATQFVEMLAQAALVDGIDFESEPTPLSEEQLKASASARTQTLHSNRANQRPIEWLSTKKRTTGGQSQEVQAKPAEQVEQAKQAKHEAATRQWVTPPSNRGSASYSEQPATPGHEPTLRRQQTASRNTPPSHRQQTASHHPAPAAPPERVYEPSRKPPARRQPVHDLPPPAPVNQKIVVVHRVERSIIWGTLSALGKLLMGILRALGHLVRGILRGWRFALVVGLLLVAIVTFRNISWPEISGPELNGPNQMVSQWQEDLTLWWLETVIQPWNEFRTGIESQVAEERIEEWAEQGGMEEVNQAITDTVNAISTAAATHFPQPNTPVPAEAQQEGNEETPSEAEPVAPTEAPNQEAQVPTEIPIAPTEVSVVPTEVSVAPTEIPPTVTPSFPFRPAFVGPDFSQGCPGFYVFGYIRDQNGNLLSGVKVRAINEYQNDIPVAISKEEPLGWYDIVISENEAYWQVQVVDANNNPLSDIVTVFNSGNYVEGSDACRHQVDFEQVS